MEQVPEHGGARRVLEAIDPRETQMLTLATEVHTLRGQLASVNTTFKAPDGNTDKPADHSNDTPRLDRMVLPGTVIEKWRTVQHGDGTTPVICDGKTFWKCNHHKDSVSRWTFMYIRHKEEYHEATVSKFTTKKPKTEKANVTAIQSGNAHINKIVAGNKLKEVLCSRLLLDDKDADDIFNEIHNDGKDVVNIGGNQGKD